VPNETDLGEAGRNFIRDRLESGLSLSAAARERLDLRNGRVFTWTGRTTSPHLLDFSRGDVFGDLGAREAGPSFVRSFFSGVSSASLWVEEALPRRSDAFWDNPSVPRDRRTAWFLGEEVYSLAFPGDNDARILEALSNGWDYGGWGGGSFLSCSPAADRYTRQHEIEEADVIALVDGVRYIICSAYDGTGYIVWCSTALPETSV
jgi:hypothetical protein